MVHHFPLALGDLLISMGNGAKHAKKPSHWNQITHLNSG
jgi:hypothetical protein